MGDGSAIEWTQATWNPVIGCTHVSAGCDNCYAAREASGRLRGVPVYAGLAQGGRFTGEVRCLPERLDQPLRWRRPRRVFVNSMSDLFHRDVSDEFIDQVYDVMMRAPQHVFQLLTKRPQRMAAWFTQPEDTPEVAEEFRLPLRPELPNVWLGTSIENDRQAYRADHLRATPAAVRFLSLEPLLGPLPSLDLAGIDWVIVGGESGPGARPMHPDWARDIRDRCVDARVPFFFKQWGEWAPAPWSVRVCDPGVGWQGTQEDLTKAKAEAEAVGATHAVAPWGHLYEPLHKPWSIERTSCEPHAGIRRVGKKAAGRQLDGRTWDEMPAQPAEARR